MNTQFTHDPRDLKAIFGILEATEESGGCTFTRGYNPKIFKPDKRYIVGGKRETLVIPFAENLHSIARRIEQFVQQSSSTDTTFGTWLNDGTLYVDVCTLHTDYLDAVLTGFERHEKAIFDIKRECEIRLT